MDNERDARRQTRDRIAKAVERLVDPPLSATDYMERFTDRARTSYRAAVDEASSCGCGGKDGIVIGVSDCAEIAPTAHNLITLTVFSHHAGGSTDTAFFDPEAAKQIVNRLGEAIAVAERVAREGAPT